MNSSRVMLGFGVFLSMISVGLGFVGPRRAAALPTPAAGPACEMHLVFDYTVTPPLALTSCIVPPGQVCVAGCSEVTIGTPSGSTNSYCACGGAKSECCNLEVQSGPGGLTWTPRGRCGTAGCDPGSTCNLEQEVEGNPQNPDIIDIWAECEGDQ